METSRTHKPLPKIFEATCKAGGVDPLAITAKHPGKMVSAFKHVGIYLARQHGHPLLDIAKTFGLTSHASALYSIKKVDDMKKDPLVKDVKQLIMKELYG